MQTWKTDQIKILITIIVPFFLQGPVVPMYKFKVMNELPVTSSMIHPADLVKIHWLHRVYTDMSTQKPHCLPVCDTPTKACFYTGYIESMLT